MTKEERQNWIDNIDNTAAAVTSIVGPATVTSVLKRFGVSCTEEATDNALPEIFSELYAIEADLK